MRSPDGLCLLAVICTSVAHFSFDVCFLPDSEAHSRSSNDNHMNSNSTTNSTANTYTNTNTDANNSKERSSNNTHHHQQQQKQHLGENNINENNIETRTGLEACPQVLQSSKCVLYFLTESTKEVLGLSRLFEAATNSHDASARERRARDRICVGFRNANKLSKNKTRFLC